MTSYWGVDHGFDVSKSDETRRHILTNTALGAATGPVGAAAHSAVKGKKGQKGAAALRSGGGALVGGTLGSMAGTLLSRGRAGSYLGAGTGGAAGAYLGSVNNTQKGRVKGLRPVQYPMSRSNKK